MYCPKCKSRLYPIDEKPMKKHGVCSYCVTYKKPLCPVCNENTDIDSNGEILLCNACARAKCEAADRADLINRCDW
jgi:hypothetical protein